MKTGFNVFIVSFVVGVLLTVASCVWWWKYRPTKFVFSGKIAGLHSYEEVSFPYMFRKEEQRPRSQYDPDQRKDERFLFVQEKPFKKGQKFEVDFAKSGNTDTTKLLIDYRPDADGEPSYSISYDSSSKANILKPEEAQNLSPLTELFAPKTVLAQTSIVVDEGKPSQKTDSKTAKLAPQGNPSPLVALQDGHTSVGIKVRTLQDLNSGTQSSIPPDLMFSASLPEPIIVTLLDLSRYSDPEVAELAGNYLQSHDVSSLIVRAVTSSDPTRKMIGELAYMHLNDGSANLVLGWLSSLKSSEAEVLRSKGNSLQIVGTYSPQGYRYYLLATWNKSDEDSVDCLTKLFNDELEGTRSLDEEKRLMFARSSRIAYWYDKNWGYSIRPKIVACGGNVRFINPYVALSSSSRSPQ